MKIFVASHLDTDPIELPVYATLRTGAGQADARPGHRHDNIGDHISERNGTYSELTALYWIWKNTDDDRVGLCHYRRFFSPVLFPENKAGVKLARDAAERILGIDPAGAIFDCELRLADMIVPTRDPRSVSARDLYVHHHRPEDWDAMIGAMADLYPAEAAPAAAFFSEVRPFHYYNMFITSRETLDSYCSWLFPLLFHTETSIVPSSDRYQARVHGFLAERLFNWWTASRRLRLIERPILLIE